MRTIKINKLLIENFKGLIDFKLYLDGNNSTISGDNGLGKTTIFDSFMWLLFDKDSLGASKFDIKPLDNEGNVIHNQEHKVFAELEIDGQIITLEKIHKEKWVRRHGEEEKTLDGHTTDYLINDIPKKKNEYNSYLSNLIDEETFKILTNPLYFNEVLHWTDRRNIALKLVDSIDDKGILDKEEYKELREQLENITVEELKDKTSNNIKKLKKETNSIPARIDELEKQVLDVNIDELNKEKEELNNKLNDLKSSDIETIKFQIRQKNGSIGLLEGELKLLEQNSKQELNNKLSEISEEGSKLKQDYLQAKSELEDKKTLLNKSKKRLEEVKEELSKTHILFDDTEKMQFDEDSKICPTCNQLLPSDDIEKMITDFKDNRKNRMNELNALGGALTEEKKKLTEEIEQLDSIVDNSTIIVNDYLLRLNDKAKEKESIEEQIKNIDIENTEEYKEKLFKLNEIKQHKEDLERQLKGESNQEELNSIQEQINEIDKQLARVDLNEENKARIKELAEKAKILNQEILSLEFIESQIKNYEIERVLSLEDKINEKFELVKFKLFNKTKDSWVETFETTVDGVRFSSLNNAMRIQAGLDIIKTLSDHYQVQAPIFLDNRESINEIPELAAQVINLVVSKHKTLNVKIEEE